jgi:hypothetical protein
MAPSEPLPRDLGSDPDGRGPNTAISVRGVPEEYAWVARNLPGARLVRQALVFLEERPFDVLTLTLKSGDEREVYFDISSFYGG